MSKKTHKKRKDKEVLQGAAAAEAAQQKQQRKLEQQRLQEERYKKSQVEKVQNGLPVKLIRVVICVFVFLLFVCQPLYVHDAFNDLGTSKFNFYAHISFGVVKYPFIVLFPGTQIIALLLWIWYAIESAVKGVFFDIFNIKKLTIPDWFVLAFMLTSILSAAFAPDKTNVLWGFPGWYMGLITMLSFGWIYFMISRFFIGKKYVIYLLVCAITGAILAAIFGIINRCGIDLFGMYQATFGGEDGAPVDPNTIARSAYLSRVGHRGWFSTYLIVILPVPLYLFWKGENPLVRLAGGLSGFIISTAASASGAMAALLGLGGILIAFLFFAFEDKKLLLRYLELQLLVFVSLQTMNILQLLFPDKPISYGDGPTEKLIESAITVGFTKVQAVLLAAVLVIVFILQYRKKGNPVEPAVVTAAGKTVVSADSKEQGKVQLVALKSGDGISGNIKTDPAEAKDAATEAVQGSGDDTAHRELNKPGKERFILGILRIAVFGTMVLAAAVLLTYVVLNSTGRLPEKYMSDSRILKLSDNSEGYRWLYWSFAVKCYNDVCKTFTLGRFLGVGPNCTYTLFTGEHAEEMKQIGGEALLANAHNEWLTEFIDEGILGGIAYCGIFFSVMASCAVRVLRSKTDSFRDYLPVLAAASAFGYFCHDTVSYQQISAAPFMFAILGLGMQHARSFQNA